MSSLCFEALHRLYSRFRYSFCATLLLSFAPLLIDVFWPQKYNRRWPLWASRLFNSPSIPYSRSVSLICTND